MAGYKTVALTEFEWNAAVRHDGNGVKYLSSMLMDAGIHIENVALQDAMTATETVTSNSRIADSGEWNDAREIVTDFTCFADKEYF